MLSEDAIADLRQRVATSHLRRRCTKPSQWVMLIDGPLDGIRVRIETSSMSSYSIGWATVTERGCVQCMYQPQDGSLQWRGYDADGIVGYSYSAPLVG